MIAGSSISFEDVTSAGRFFWRLPSFLRRRISPEQARSILRRRLERRDADLLGLAKRAIYENAASPYRQLLKLAGCEYGDLEQLVCREGVDGALRILLRHGVYLTVDEFKGRRPAVRGSAMISVNPNLLRNPSTAFHVLLRSGGSRSQGTVVPFDLAFIRDCAINTCLTFEARGGRQWLKADWEVPGAGAMLRLLKFSSFGAPPVRWFSHVDPAAPGLHPRYRWSARVMRWGGFLAGVRLPRPQHVSVQNPLPVAQWIAEVLREGGTPHLFTFPSSAVRLCEAASRAGLQLSGAQLMVTGEPFTAARLSVIRRAGVAVQPRYGSIETGPIGYGCLDPEVSDDLHLLHDLHALVQVRADEETPEFPANALLVSSLRPTAPLVLLNVSLGDQAVVVRRSCACPMEKLGWVTHLHTVRSYEKLTGEGMTFLDTDVIRVLEEVLPRRFGGVATDYQLVEEETEDGRPRLRLLVHPGIGSLDSEAVAEAFLAAIGAGSGAQRVMELTWRHAGLLRVDRRVPLSTSAGKILHLHLDRRAPGRGARRGSPSSRP